MQLGLGARGHEAYSDGGLPWLEAGQKHQDEGRTGQHRERQPDAKQWVSRRAASSCRGDGQALAADRA